MSAFEWAGTIAGFAALLLGILLTLVTLGVFRRPHYAVSATYFPESDLAVFMSGTACFVVELENRGNVPVVFSSFELVLPRTDVCDTASGTFIAHTGAKLLLDGKDTGTRISGHQLLNVIDYRTLTVELPPQHSRVVFLDPSNLRESKASPPPRFEPVLTFRDSFRKGYHCDAEGLHRGPYLHPDTHDPAFRRAFPTQKKANELLRWRTRLFPRRWKAREQPAATPTE